MKLSNRLRQALFSTLNSIEVKPNRFLLEDAYATLEISTNTINENDGSVIQELNPQEDVEGENVDIESNTTLKDKIDAFLQDKIKELSQNSTVSLDDPESKRASELFTTQAFKKDEPLDESKVANEKDLSHPVYQHMAFLKAVKQKDKNLVIEMLKDGYTGFNAKDIISYKAGFEPSKAQIDILKGKGVNPDDLEKYQSLVKSFYKDENQLLCDQFVLTKTPIQMTYGDALGQLKNGADVLVSEVFDPNLLMNITDIDGYGGSVNFTVKPQTQMSYELAQLIFSDNVNIVEPGFTPLKNTFDFTFGRVSTNGKTEINNKDYSESYLREDEKSVVKALSSSDNTLIQIPSVLMSEKRGVFHDSISGIKVDQVIRLPLDEKENSYDLILKNGKHSLTAILPDNVLDVKGDSLLDSGFDALDKTYYGETVSNDKIAYQIKAYKYDEWQSLPGLVNGPQKDLIESLNSLESKKGRREGCFYFDGNDIPGIYKDGKLELLKGIKAERAKHFMQLNDALRGAFYTQKTGLGSQGAMSLLNEAYQAFVDKLGFVSERKNELLLSSDYRYANITMLEESQKNPETGETTYKPSSWLIDHQFSSEPKNTLSVNEFILSNFEQNGRFDLDEIASHTGMEAGEAKEYIIENQLGFLVGDELVHKDIYLSGNVAEKLEQAKTMLESNPAMHRNIAALNQFQPKPIEFDDIYFTLGSHWIDESILNEFVREKTGETVGIKKNPISLSWAINPEGQISLRKNKVFNSQYSVGYKLGVDVLETALNQGSTTIMKGGAVDIETSEIFKSKVEQIQSEFKQFVASSPNHKAWLEQTYNRLFNGYKKVEFKAVNPSLKGMSVNINLRPHQINSIHSGLHFGSFLYAHDAGSGKTFTQVGTAMMNAKLTGKPSLIAVPNHMPSQMRREAIQLFPEARVLYLDNDILKKPEDLLIKINSIDFDILIIKHDSLNRYLSAPIEHENKILMRERHKVLSLMDYFTGNRNVQAELSKSLGTIDKRMNKLKENNKLSIDKLNVGSLIVDEAHNFKNLEIINPTGNMIDSINGSDRALSLKMMIDYFYSINKEDKGVIFATGTPVSNSLLEIYNLQSYLQPRLMEKLGLHSIKNWMDTFLEVKTQYEPDVTGQKYIPKSRYILKNIPELISILSNSMNVVTIEDAGIKVPESKMHYESCPLDDPQADILETLIARLDAVKEKRVSPAEDNMLKIISDSRKMALSPGLIADSFGNRNPTLSPKINKVCDNIMKEYESSHDISGTQLVFCDLGTPSGFPDGNSLYDLIKNGLIERGMPQEQVAFIHDPKNEKEKDLLFSSVREGSVRVLIGSTPKMGEGTNVQERIVASHDVDPPWRPKDIIQRRRRTVRQGNINEDVSLYVYMTDNSFDAYAWAKLDSKNKAFSYIMSGKAVARSFELELDPSFSEAYAAVTGKDELIEAAQIENDLIRLNANKKGLERQIESANNQLNLNNQSIRELDFEYNCASQIKIANQVKNWAIQNNSVTRKEILKNRENQISYNGMEVIFNKDKAKWIIGGFEFNRPSGIEKSLVIDAISTAIEKNDFNGFMDSRNKMINDINQENIELFKVIKNIDQCKFDEEIKSKTAQLEHILESLNDYHEEYLSR